MNLEIQHLVINNPASADSLQLMSGFVGAIIGGLIAGGITWWAMYDIDKKNKERWQKDSLQRMKNEAKVDSIGGLASCLNFITARDNELLNLSDAISISFDWEIFESSFKQCHNSLSKLIVYYSNESEFYKKLKEIIRICQMCLLIFHIINLIKNHSEAYQQILADGNIMFESEDVFYINLLKFIQFINMKPLQTWHIGEKEYCFHREFNVDYNSDFVGILKRLKSLGDEVYKTLVKECEL